MSLDNIRIVLVAPTHAGNIGGAARAMRNMALHRLHLVSPADFSIAEASARAAGADDVLNRLHVDANLTEALADCRYVIGTSARSRRLAWPQYDPATAARQLVAEAGQGAVALVFGAERTGLTNAELERCHGLVTIPTDPGFSSLNLACAVQIMAYELFLAQGRGAHSEPFDTAVSEPLADSAEVERFYRHLEQVLIEIDFLDPQHPRKLMRRLIRLFSRVRLEVNEVHILRGILTAIQDRRNRPNI
ncbi:MAG: tRNA (cytosine(32)/uridine(32)-2'-O)-methyltransferase TrmJ [Candidatus Muproteobacteria bacterium RBG_16_64_11]|uniref:tRNA (cytidine/uridine-2'-O-)-methyltransferase TrmJ n=1 Tax=Candidatus Muproteobacteria bacterium RBG_16_64_11 TaxID=1817758 RepID=A0A1F6TAZ7_9PROT|nr:MAG: tRNA (cytosine(32)/uridine(32)-2'-O)-methyltransferase TrmJ [Candidatus Muproteobacteria bacterium RBG_16_64_11]